MAPSTRPSAAGDGFATLPFGGDDVLTALALQPDGKLVVAGLTFSPTGVGNVFARLGETDGFFDDTFADIGTITLDFGSPSMQVDDVALQPDGRIVYTGTIDRNGFPPTSSSAGC